MSFGNISFSNTIQMSSGMISPTTKHITTPPSFATSAWSHPLQHKHNIQETRPTARIISPGNTTLFLCPPPPSSKLLSKGPTCWPLSGHPPLVDDRSDWDCGGELHFPFACRHCGPAVLTFLTGWRAIKGGQLVAFRGLSSCYHEQGVCF